MKHRYDGHDDIMRIEPADIGLKLAERVQIAAAMGVGDAFRASRGARGEAEATRCGKSPQMIPSELALDSIASRSRAPGSPTFALQSGPTGSMMST